MEDDDPGVEGGGGEPVSAGVGMKREGLWKSVTDLLLTGKGMTHVMKGVGGGGEKTIYNTHKTVTTSLSTGGGPVSYVQLSEGGFQVVYPLGLWSRLSGVVKVLYGYG